MVIGEGKLRAGLQWFWGADGGARAVLVMRGYGKSGEVGDGRTKFNVFQTLSCDLSFGLGYGS